MGNKIVIEDLAIEGLRIRTAYRRANPDTVPLLIFNGIGANLELFFPFMQALPQIDTLIFDMPGIGGSSAPLIPYRFKGYAQLGRKVIEHYGHECVDVIGVSWGGALAQEFAYRESAYCRRLILAATSPGSIMVPGRLSVLLKLTSPKRYLLADYLKTNADIIYGGKFREDLSMIEDYVDLMKAGSSKRGYYGQLSAGVGWTSVHWLHKLSQPCLILAGSDDPIVPLVNAKLLQMRIPNSRLEVVDCGHLFLFTMLDEIIPTIKQFLSEEDPV